MPRSAHVTGILPGVLSPLGVRAALLVLTALLVVLARPGPPPPPPVTVVFVYSPDAGDVVAPLIDQYNQYHRSVEVHGVQMASGAAERRIAGLAGRPLPATIWMPATSLWAHVLESDIDARWWRTPRSLLKSPEVFAVWPSVAARLGRPISWHDVIARALAGARAHQPFRLTLTNVDTSTSGLFAAISIFATVAHVDPSSLSLASVDNARRHVRLLERALAHYPAKASDICPHLLASGEHYMSVAFMQETTFVACNRELRRANQHLLEGVYPSGGTFVADYPFVILSGAPWSSERRVSAAEAFSEWMQARVVQRAAELGYRLPRSFTTPPPGGVRPPPEATETPPRPDVIGHLRAVWDENLSGR